MGRCLGRKDETKNSCRTSVGKFVATGKHRKWRRERDWVLTLSWVSVETFLNVEYSEWTCSKC